MEAPSSHHLEQLRLLLFHKIKLKTNKTESSSVKEAGRALNQNDLISSLPAQTHLVEFSALPNAKPSLRSSLHFTLDSVDWTGGRGVLRTNLLPSASPHGFLVSLRKLHCRAELIEKALTLVPFQASVFNKQATNKLKTVAYSHDRQTSLSQWVAAGTGVFTHFL